MTKHNYEISWDWDVVEWNEKGIMSDYCSKCQEYAERMWDIGDVFEIPTELHEWIHGFTDL
jgi:hypothetical protein